MDAEAMRRLNLNPRSDEELHDVYNRFLTKWEHKIERGRLGQTAKR